MTKGWGGLGALGRPNILMDNHQKRQKLEAELRASTGEERRQIIRELEKLSGRHGADTRPRGEEADKR